jgi:hypothetical protein
MRILLNRLRSCLGTLPPPPTLAMHVGSRCGRCTLKFSQDRTWSQTALAKGQSKDRWTLVSNGPLHKTQCSWCGHPLFYRLSAVRILPCLRIQACTLHLFSACVFQMRLCWNVRCEPHNCILYAIPPSQIISHFKNFGESKYLKYDQIYMIR